MERLRELFGQYPQIEPVILYGSRAKGNYRLGSDIDLTLQGEALDLTTLLEIENRIDDLLLPWTVDLSLHRQIDNAELIAHIKRVGMSFYTASTRGPGTPRRSRPAGDQATVPWLSVSIIDTPYDNI